MVEVCFSDSVKGSLAVAQRCGKEKVGAVSVITDKKGVAALFAKRKAVREFRKRQAELAQVAVPIGGKREDIAGLSFGLSEGDIQVPILAEECPRKAHIRVIFAYDRYEEQEAAAGFDAFWTACLCDLHKTDSAPQMRVWVDATPDAQCGLLFLADRLRDADAEIHVVELPPFVAGQEKDRREYRGWGDVAPQLFGTFLDRESVLTKGEVVKLADRWQRLKGENAPLRVVRDGCVTSAEADYYDDRIRKEFPQDACKVAHIIGGALGRQKIPVGDGFIAKRIRHFIETGELVLSDKASGSFYGATVTHAG